MISCSARISNMKLRDDQVIEILQRLEAGGVYQAELAVEYAVSQATISNIVNGKRRTGVRGRNRPPAGRITDEGRECSRCGKFKPWDEYSPNPYAKLTGHQSACKLCRNDTKSAVVASDLEAHRLRARTSYLARKYGITPEQYDQLSEQQEHKCALCLQPEVQRRREDRHGIVRVVDLLSIDHDHSCERHSPKKACVQCIRGLLCDDCNRLIGFAEAKPVVAARFSDYLALRPFMDRAEVV